MAAFKKVGDLTFGCVYANGIVEFDRTLYKKDGSKNNEYVSLKKVRIVRQLRASNKLDKEIVVDCSKMETKLVSFETKQGQHIAFVDITNIDECKVELELEFYKQYSDRVILANQIEKITEITMYNFSSYINPLIFEQKFPNWEEIKGADIFRKFKSDFLRKIESEKEADEKARQITTALKTNIHAALKNKLKFVEFPISFEKEMVSTARYYEGSYGMSHAAGVSYDNIELKKFLSNGEEFFISEGYQIIGTLDNNEKEIFELHSEFIELHVSNHWCNDKLDWRFEVGNRFNFMNNNVCFNKVENENVFEFEFTKSFENEKFNSYIWTEEGGEFRIYRAVKRKLKPMLELPKDVVEEWKE